MTPAFIRGEVSSKGVALREIEVPGDIWDGVYHRRRLARSTYGFRKGLHLSDVERYAQVCEILYAIDVLVDSDGYLRNLSVLTVPVPFYLNAEYNLLEHIYGFTERKRPPALPEPVLFSKN